MPKEELERKEYPGFPVLPVFPKGLPLAEARQMPGAEASGKCGLLQQRAKQEKGRMGNNWQAPLLAAE